MARDSKLKNFSHTMFNYIRTNPTCWATNILPDYDEKKYSTEDYIKLFHILLMVKHFYSSIFEKIFEKYHHRNHKSREAVRDYICSTFSCENWFRKLTIFERCLVTISFVWSWILYLHSRNIFMARCVLRYDYAWAGYFIKYMDEFYNEGGWTELKRVANSYVGVYDLLDTHISVHNINDFIKSSKSVGNYMYFYLLREDIPLEKSKSKIFKELEIRYCSKHKTSAISWIKFIVQNGSANSFDAIFTKTPYDPSEVSCLLRVIRILCDPNSFISSVIGEVVSSYEEKRQESSNSGFKKEFPLQSSENEKEREGKDINIKSFTGSEDCLVENAAVGAKVLRKSRKIKNRLKKRRSKVSDKNAYLGETVFSNSNFNNVPPQNIETAKNRKDSGNKISSECEHVSNHNENNTSSISRQMLNRSNKQEKNKKGAEIQVSDKSLELGKAIKQEYSDSIYKKTQLQNNVVEKEDDGIRIENIKGGKNVRVGNSLCISSKDNEILKKSNKWEENSKKASLQVSDKNVELREVPKQVSSSAIGRPIKERVFERFLKKRSKS